ncbi:MAG: glycosyltransferase, partial [Methylococcales bacterium]
MSEPLIACLCPTYKRPEYLRNSIACFVSQTHPNKVLVILDDAGQHAAREFPAEDWRLVSQPDRCPNLPAKFNALAAMAPRADILVVWEDDDIYLPHHLAAIAEAAASTGEAAYFAPNRVLTTTNHLRSGTRENAASGGFHASWAYTRRLWELLGGYDYGNRLDFDQHMGRRCRDAVGVAHYDETDIGRRFGPSYVYRWGNGVYHGSQAGTEGYANLWRRLGELPFERIERTGPRMDAATSIIYALHGWAKRCAKCRFELTESENEVCEACKDIPFGDTTIKPTYSIQSSMKKPHREKLICLVMLVKDESAIIERCLASVLDVIDTWLIIDTGSSDDTADKAQRLLKNIPGEWLRQPWRDFATNRNQLLELSRERADYSLWLDADETLILGSGSPWDGLTASAYAIELQTPQGSFMPIRLVRHDAKVRFVGAIAETLIGIDESVPLNNVAIHHHEDGVRWRDPVRNKRDILRIETALLDDPTDPELTLALAERHAAHGELTTALHYYRKRAELGGNEAQTWYALYQAARMLDDCGFATPLVNETYLAAYDFRPTKAEPLVRIARRCLQEGRYDTASDIALAAVSTPFEDRAYFFEPDIYRGQRDLLYLRATLELGRYADVVECAEQLTTELEHSPKIQQEIDELRSIALQRQADGSKTDINSPGTEPQSEERRPIPVATPRRDKRKLCIGMATYDDYDGVY